MVERTQHDSGARNWVYGTDCLGRIVLNACLEKAAAVRNLGEADTMARTERKLSRDR